MSEGTYLEGAWINTARPMYLVRHTGVGENIVRNGDLVADIVSGRITAPDGPLWLAPEKLAQLSTHDLAALRKAGVTSVEAIQTVTIDTRATMARTTTTEEGS